MAKYILTLGLLLLLVAGTSSSCKSPMEPRKTDSTKCDTCQVDTSKHPCDTCNHSAADTTSHAFQWKEMTIAGESDLTGVWVFGPDDIWCNGNDLYHYDGSTWTKKNFTTSTVQIGALSGYSLFSPDSTLWLTQGSIIDHCFPNTGFAIQYRPNVAGGILHAAWGTSSTDMFFVGDNGTILHFDGSNWINYPKVTTKGLASIWGTSSADVWAAGFDNNTAASTLLHYDGSVWQEIDLHTLGNIQPGAHGLEAVWTCDSAGHRITLCSGSLVWRGTDQGIWRSDSGKVPNATSDGGFVALEVLRGTTSNDVFTAGSFGLLIHWNGNTWHRYDEFYEPSNDLRNCNALSFKGNTACVVGTNNNQSWILLGQR